MCLLLGLAKMLSLFFSPIVQWKDLSFAKEISGIFVYEGEYLGKENEKEMGYNKYPQYPNILFP